MKKPLTVILSGIIDEDEASSLREYLESTEDIVWLSKTTRCRKYTLRGVPASMIDIIIDESVGVDSDTPIEVEETRPIVFELSRKMGRYDGSVRDRICVRRRLGHQVKHLSLIDLSINRTDYEIVLSLILLNDKGVEINKEQRRYTTLRSDLNDYSLARIVMWHWRRYYLHLKDGDAIREMADKWATEVSEESQKWTLAEANRAASRRLYRYSRDEGWRKLTLRQRNKYDIRAQWVRDEIWAEAVNKRFGNTLGVGEYTLYISHP